MALSLNQVDSNRKKRAQDNGLQKERPARPWEAASSASASFTGNQAVKRASEIVSKNNKIIEEIRSLGASEKGVEEIESLINEREQSFKDFEEQDFEVKKIKSGSGLLSRMKSLFMQ